jgi:hypothetical protein
MAKCLHNPPPKRKRRYFRLSFVDVHLNSCFLRVFLLLLPLCSGYYEVSHRNLQPLFIPGILGIYAVCFGYLRGFML